MGRVCFSTAATSSHCCTYSTEILLQHLNQRSTSIAPAKPELLPLVHHFPTSTPTCFQASYQRMPQRRPLFLTAPSTLKPQPIHGSFLSPMAHVKSSRATFSYVNSNMFSSLISKDATKKTALFDSHLNPETSTYTRIVPMTYGPC